MNARTALVTGGASGIGEAVVRALRADGFTTVSLDLRAGASADVSVLGDVSEPQANASAVEAAIKATGQLDVVVANAGVHDGGLGLDEPPDELLQRMRRVYDIDVIGYALAVQAALIPLRAARGHVVLTLSDASFLVGQQGAGIAYTAAKHAGVGMVGWLARELAPEVSVNAIAPGGVMTSLQAVDAGGSHRDVFDDPDAQTSEIERGNPLQTVLTVDEVAAYYQWIVSDQTRGLTGQIIRPDGGLSVN